MFLRHIITSLLESNNEIFHFYSKIEGNRLMFQKIFFLDGTGHLPRRYSSSGMASITDEGVDGSLSRTTFFQLGLGILGPIKGRCESHF